jgi:hypothetical protein
LDSPETPQQQPDLVTPNQARTVEPTIPAPDDIARKELEFWHAQRTQEAEQGWIGKAFGSKTEKPGNIAALVVLLSFLMIFAAYGISALNGKDPSSESFFKITSTFLGVVGLALGYLFGSSSGGGKGNGH